MPLYEIASDPSNDYSLRQIAVRSLEQLGFERRRDKGPPVILAWLSGYRATRPEIQEDGWATSSAEATGEEAVAATAAPDKRATD